MSSWSKGLEWPCPGFAPEPQLLVEKNSVQIKPVRKTRQYYYNGFCQLKTQQHRFGLIDSLLYVIIGNNAEAELSTIHQQHKIMIVKTTFKTTLITT